MIFLWLLRTLYDLSMLAQIWKNLRQAIVIVELALLLETEIKRTLKGDQDLNQACQVLAKTLLKIYQD